MLKKGYMIFVCSILFCYTVNALPQDWPCGEFAVSKGELLAEDEDSVEYIYRGSKDTYQIEVPLWIDKAEPFRFADCGSHGCSGTVKDTANHAQETVSFFCEENNKDNFDKASCYIGGNDELIFSASNNVYISKSCKGSEIYSRIDLQKCHDCRCIAEYFDKNGAKRQGVLPLNCTRETKDKIHCYTYNGYENAALGTMEDFKNCTDFAL